MNLYLDCLAREMRPYKGTKVQTIYIGGGTPTWMEERHLRRLNDMIRENFCFSSKTEWTVEANPEGLDCSKLKLLKSQGVHRMSLGVQSLNDKYLKYLGRNHNVSMAVEGFHRIREAGFDNINVDMMISYPGQTLDELKKDVDAVTRLGSEHLSLYTLTVEEHSRFYAKNIQLQDNHDQAKQYTHVCESLAAAGFEQYEVSNFAKPLKVSRHNMNYWEGGHYIGLGVGAHSYLGTRRFWNVSRLTDYVSRIQKGNSAEKGFEELAPYDQMKEIVLFGLRMNHGIDVEQIKKRWGCFLGEEQQKKIERFIQDGFLIQENGCLKTSSQGRLVLDELCAQLI